MEIVTSAAAAALADAGQQFYQEPDPATTGRWVEQMRDDLDALKHYGMISAWDDRVVQGERGRSVRIDHVVRGR